MDNTALMMGYGASLMIFSLPLLGIFWMYLKGIRQGFTALIGACVYFNFYTLLFTIVIVQLIGQFIPGFTEMMNLPAGKAFFYAVVGGGLVEVGRLVGFRFGTGGKKRWIDAVGLGLGYGVAANIPYVWTILETMAITSYVQSQIVKLGEDGFVDKVIEYGYTAEQAQGLLDIALNQSMGTSLMYSIQIITTVVFAVALSLLVLGMMQKDLCFEKTPAVCLMIAIASHILIDGVPILVQGMYDSIQTNYLLAGYLLLCAAGAGWFIRWSIKKYGDDPYDEPEARERKQKKLKRPASGSSISANATRKVK